MAPLVLCVYMTLLPRFFEGGTTHITQDPCSGDTTISTGASL